MILLLAVRLLHSGLENIRNIYILRLYFRKCFKSLKGKHHFLEMFGMYV